MKEYVVIGDDVYPIDSAEQLQIARQKLMRKGQGCAKVYVADTRGDHMKGTVILAAPWTLDCDTPSGLSAD